MSLDDAVMALALEISAHEAAIAKAERLARVSLYQQIQLSPDELGKYLPLVLAST